MNKQQAIAKADRLAARYEDDYYVVNGDNGIEVVSGSSLDTHYWFIEDSDIIYSTGD